MIKTILKSKTTEETQQADKAFYERAFVNAVQTHTATTFSFKDGLTTMTVEQLKDVRTYPTHDKTPKDKKFAKLIEFLAEYRDLEQVMGKLHVAMDTMRKLCLDDLEENFADADGVIQMEKVKDAITSRIAIAESLGMDDLFD